MAFTVTVRQDGKEQKKEYSSSVSLMDAVAESGFCFDLPCGGRGICGNCKVLAHGELNAPSEEEKAFLTDGGIERGERLACMAFANGNAVIEIPSYRLSELGSMVSASTVIKPITGSKECFACALDIGTTTLAFKYYSLPDGRLIFSDHAGNPQRSRGGDVLTRVSYAADGGIDELKDLVERAVDESRGRFGRNVEFYVITGNTAMLHILSGKNPKGIAVAPFEPETLFGFWEGNRYYMRCASAYIGADAVASLLASGALKQKGAVALLDIGTNNECILWDGSRLFACSSPAGPAFEGANISCGMAARSGAITAVFDDNGIPVVTTADGISEPAGFCGSGLIDAAAFLLKNGYIAKDGSIAKDIPCFGKAKLEGQDIAELQLAKSAVCAGLLTLCRKAGIDPDELESLYLTGSFGNKLNPESAETIGLIPKGTAKKTVCLGCGAVEGASALLLNKDMIEESERLARNIETVEPADSEFFASAFIENLYF